MKHTLRLLASLLCLSLAFLALGCGPKRPTLHIYNWADYMDPDLIAEFERAYGCRVVIDTFDSNESLYAKIKAGAKGYDLIFPTTYMSRIMFEEGLIQTIDHTRIPNLVHIDRDYLRDLAVDKRMTYSVPYMIGTTGIAYRQDQVQNVEPTWAVFDRTDLRRRMTMLNDMRETIGAALKFLGYSLNTTDEAQLEEALVVVRRWQANLAKFEAEAYKPGIASGEFLVVHGYMGDIMQVQEENENVVFLLPREGFAIGCDDMVIPVSARQVDLAYQFINFLHEPANAARNTNFTFYLSPNTAAYPLMNEEIRENPAIFVPEHLLKKAEIIRDLGADNAKYIRVWDRIRSGN